MSDADVAEYGLRQTQQWAAEADYSRWLATMATAERAAIRGSSRAEKVGHKAAAEAYETALARFADVHPVKVDISFPPGSTYEVSDIAMRQLQRLADARLT